MSISKVTHQSLALLDEIIGEPMTLGSVIRSIRECEEKTQVALAKMLGVSRQRLCDIEHGRRFLSPKMAAQFAKKLGYSENQFVRLAIQDVLVRDGLALTVEIKNVA